VFPQIHHIIGGARIGVYTELKKHFGQKALGENDTTYVPVTMIFATSMVALAIQKLQDVESFVNSFLGYDLLARRYVPYGYACPYAELYAGVGMMALIGTGNALIWVVAPVAMFIGMIGAVSVIKAVYIDKQELTCACVGGGSNVPLGFISMTENLVMLGMGFWMLGLHVAG